MAEKLGEIAAIFGRLFKGIPGWSGNFFIARIARDNARTADDGRHYLGTGACACGLVTVNFSHLPWNKFGMSFGSSVYEPLWKRNFTATIILT